MYGTRPIQAWETKVTHEVRDEADVHDEVGAVLRERGAHLTRRRINTNAFGTVGKVQCGQQ